MVELKLEPVDGELAKDHYVSVRVGEVQKLSRISNTRAYKFPQSAIGDRKFGKIEIFRKVGGATVGIVPENETDQEVNVQLEGDGKIKFRVSLSGDGGKSQPVKVDQPEEKPTGNPKVQLAKAYLEEHNLEMRLSEAMQAVLREKPADPAAFVAAKLAASAGMVQKVNKSPASAPTSPPAAAPAAASPPAAAPAAAGGKAQALGSIPFTEYYSANLRTISYEGIHSKFPAPKPAAAAASPAPAPAPAAAAPPVTTEVKPVEDNRPWSAGEAKASPAALPCASHPDGASWTSFMTKPSVGTWAAFPRGPKLPRGAAGAS